MELLLTASATAKTDVKLVIRQQAAQRALQRLLKPWPHPIYSTAKYEIGTVIANLFPRSAETAVFIAKLVSMDSMHRAHLINEAAKCTRIIPARRSLLGVVECLKPLAWAAATLRVNVLDLPQLPYLVADLAENIANNIDRSEEPIVKYAGCVMEQSHRLGVSTARLWRSILRVNPEDNERSHDLIKGAVDQYCRLAGRPLSDLVCDKLGRLDTLLYQRVLAFRDPHGLRYGQGLEPIFPPLGEWIDDQATIIDARFEIP